MRGFDKKFNMMQRFVVGFIIFVAFLVVAQIIIMGIAAYAVGSAAVEQDWSGGIKPVIEKVWCGQPGCTNK